MSSIIKTVKLTATTLLSKSNILNIKLKNPVLAKSNKIVTNLATSILAKKVTATVIKASQLKTNIGPSIRIDQIAPPIPIYTTTVSQAATEVITTAIIPKKKPNIWLQNAASATKSSNKLSVVEQIKKTSSTKKFDSIEQLIGISKSRPEIISITEFLPLFDVNGNFTSTGVYADAKTSLDQLQLKEWQQTLNTQNSSELKTKLINARSEFTTKLCEMSTVADYFSNLYKVLQFAKENLNLKQFEHNINYVDFIQSNYNNNKFITNNSVTQIDDLSGFLKQNITSPLTTLKSILKTRFGFNEQNVENFTSTKLWLQNTYEFKNLIENHTNLLIGKQYDNNQNDCNPTDILNLNEGKNTVSFKSITGIMPTLKQISQAAPEEITSMYVNITNSYGQIKFGTSDYALKLSTLLWLFSKEYRFSIGLKKSEVIQTLFDSFAYQVTDKNDDLFDNICGLYANSIYIIPQTIDNSLRSIAYNIPQNSNVAVMNFESNFMSSNSGITSPGSEYYFDSILNDFGQNNQTFNVINLQNFLDKLTKTSNSINTIAYGMNWLLEGRLDNTRTTTDTLENKLNLPHLLYDLIFNKFVNTFTERLKDEFLNDSVSAIIKAANEDNNIKSLLFILLILRFERNSDYASQVDVLQKIKDIISKNLQITNIKTLSGRSAVAALESQVKEYNGVSNKMFDELLTGNSNVMSAFYDILNTAYQEIKNITKNSYSIYSGVMDTTLLMSIFDIAISVFSSFSELRFDSLNKISLFDTTKNDYVAFDEVFILKRISIDIDTINMNHSKILTRLTYERMSLVDSYVAIVGTMIGLQNNIQSVINYLQSNKSKNNFDYLMKVSPSLASQEYMKLLLNEQQMMIVNSTIEDLKSIINHYSTTIFDVDFDSAVSNEDYNEILDDSIITPIMKNILFSLLKSQQYTSTKGYNKKILTVGLPIGFTEKFQQLTNLTQNKNLSNKKQQNDIIAINLYKIDVRNPDVVWKPKQFLFEMSRFVSKDCKNHLDFKSNMSILDMCNSFATRDLTQESFTKNDTLFYGNSTQDSKIFSTSDYDFLSLEQKNELIQNHVLSFIAELYVKFLTNMSLTENTFTILQSTVNEIITQDLAQSLLRNRLQVLLQASKNVSDSSTNLFSNLDKQTFETIDMNIALGNITSVNDLIEAIPQSQVENIVNEIRAINVFCNTKSVYTNSDVIANQIFMPKQFDRIFNIFVDPDDFYIDFVETTKTFEGNEALKKLIENNDIINISTDVTTPSYKQTSKDKVDGDVSFDKYYVNVQTLGELNV